jgi:eukaryotic-like serine/threonine-protein kinase
MSKSILLHSYIGEYHLVDFLGAGGMGEVYRAVHTKLGRVVAIKVLTQAAHSPGFTERFLNEARIQASLRHQNIATLYDFLELNNQPCIIMEYVDGQTLLERVMAGSGLPLPEAVSIFQAVVKAVEYIHSQGITHRDIKPQNVKISSTGEVKLLDFGIAKADTSPGLTTAGTLVGTLQYLSPEQLQGQAADARSDIWALGALLYEMVTGAAPFEAPTIAGLYEQISKAVYISPSALKAAVPRELEAVISRCIKKRPSERYQSAGELLKAIELVATATQPRADAGQSKTSIGKTFIDAVKKNWRAASVFAAIMLSVLLALHVVTQPSGPAAPVAPRPADNKNVKLPGAEQTRLKSFQIDAADGRSEVYINGQRVGTTPCQFDARIGDRVDLLLKRDGFVDRREQFTVTENKKVYTFSMIRQE